MNNQNHGLGPRPLTVPEAASFLRCSEGNVRRMLYRGSLSGFRVGDGERAAWRIHPEAIRDWIRRGQKAIAKAGEEREVFHADSVFRPPMTEDGQALTSVKDPRTGRYLTEAEHERMLAGLPPELGNPDPLQDFDKWAAENPVGSDDGNDFGEVIDFGDDDD